VAPSNIESGKHFTVALTQLNSQH